MQAPDNLKKCCENRQILVRKTHTARELYCYRCREVLFTQPIEEGDLGELIELAEKEETHPLYLALKEAGQIVRAYDDNISGKLQSAVRAAKETAKERAEHYRTLNRIDQVLSRLDAEIQYLKEQVKK